MCAAILSEYVLADHRWKESLNSNSQQVHQYQQNEQSPLTSTHWT
jgi:hypothetical protein